MINFICEIDEKNHEAYLRLSNGGIIADTTFDEFIIEDYSYKFGVATSQRVTFDETTTFYCDIVEMKKEEA